MTPNIQIGTVTQGTSFNVTRTGTNENPVLNFTLVKGDKGDRGIQGIQGLTGNGISSITKTGTSGLVDTYTITYTNGNTTTFTITNGEDGEVTETELNVLRQKLENQQKVINQLPQVEGQGTSITLENTIEAQFTEFDEEGNSTQETTTGKNKVDVTSGNLYNVPETLTLTQREDGRLFLNGKMNGTTTQLIFNMNFANIENGKTYKIVTKVVSGTWDKSIIGMQFRNSNGQQIQTLQNSSSTQESKVIEGDVAEVRLYFGGTFEATNLVIEIMLVEASVTDDSFEKFTYGASPNPNYEQPIKSAGDDGSINEKIQTRNLFDGTREVNSTYTNSIKTALQNYKNTGKYATGYINNNNIIAGDNRLFTAFTEIKSGEVYTINNTYSATANFSLICFLDKDGNVISKNTEWSSQAYTHTATNEEKYIAVGAFLTSLNYIQIEPGTTATPYVPHKEQDYSIFVQQPMRSIGDVRDCFVKKSDGKLYERHLPYIASYNGETLPKDVYNEVDNVKYCNEKSMSTTGQFSIGASVQYIDENNWNDLPCTETQIQQLENKPSTYKDFTIIQSEDETPAYLEVGGIYDLNKLINN